MATPSVKIIRHSNLDIVQADGGVGAIARRCSRITTRSESAVTCAQYNSYSHHRQR
ncbi:hypothetical protein L484_015794 [Morus notabilis]|uniref:Uncharacterized protein n=1 Tax=Morus notabilis TaxID=981085 RepID=W9QCZ5_9ROSA|nr:hypothetical protein L484_015794 [Morus notabilis]